MSNQHAGLDDVTTIVLVGGKGTRISRLHPTVPKPLIDVGGRPFLYWLTAFLASHGLRSFVYASGHMADQIAAWCGDGSFPQLDRRSQAEKKPLGTGGGLLNCLDAVATDWILVVNGDSICVSGLYDLLALRRATSVRGGLIGVLVDDAARYGSLDIDAEGLLKDFREKVPGRAYINGGLYLLRRDDLSGIRQPGACSIERDLIPDLIDRGIRLAVTRLDEAPFIDIGTPESLQEAERFVRDHICN